MRTPASIAGHPIHPMLVPVAIGLWLFSFACDIIYAAGVSGDWKTVALYTMIGGIDATNTPSIRLHETLGFEKCASIKQAGFKFGRWLDLELYQLILPTPESPVDG